MVKYLKSHNIDTIFALIIIHPHPDHAGGVFHILPVFKVLRKYDNGSVLESIKECMDFYRWYGEIFRKPFYRPLRAGDKWEDGGVLFEVLWPFEITGNLNDDSLVIKLTYGSRKYSKQS